MTHDKPYIRPCTGDTGAALVWGAREYEPTAGEMMLWMAQLLEHLQRFHIVEVQPCQEVQDE